MPEPKVILAGTGHRPQKLGPDGFSRETSIRLHALATLGIKRINPELVISGMAWGWDLAVAHAAIDLGIPVLAAIPHDGHGTKAPAASQQRYQAILRRCAERKIVTDGPYAAWKMQARNVWMTDRCTDLLALWDGSDGGTANCVRYAEGLRPPPKILNMWGEWLAMPAPPR